MDRICFPSASLAISKYCAIVALEAAICNRFGNVVEECQLVDLFVANEVKEELFGVTVAAVKLKEGSVFDGDASSFVWVIILLLVERAGSNDNFDLVAVL